MDYTTDTVGSYVSELASELTPVFDRINGKYAGVPVDVFACFRCLPDEYGRKSRRVLSRKDNTLYLDMTLSADRYGQLSKVEQRREMGFTFVDYLADSLRRYRLPGLDIPTFLDDLRGWLREAGWLTEAGQIYVCADLPVGHPGNRPDECACLHCILDTAGPQRRP